MLLATLFCLRKQQSIMSRISPVRLAYQLSTFPARVLKMYQVVIYRMSAGECISLLRCNKIIYTETVDSL